MNQKINPQQLYDYLSDFPGSSITTMAKQFGVTTATIHLIVNKLLGEGRILKKGKTPHVQYYLDTASKNNLILPADVTRMLDQERYQISKTGQELIGIQGFARWCEERGQEPIAASIRWKGHIDYLDQIKTPYGIRATHKLNDYGVHHLQDLWYANIYALPEFGKTKYGTRMELAKTYPSTKIFSLLSQSMVLYLDALILDQKVDALCFAQPTAKRTMQIMDYLSKTVRIDLPRVQIQKTPGYFPAQKTLKRREDRIANAQASFEIKGYDHAHYRHVVIIDDAVGSGATLAEIGNKLIDAGITDQVTGFSVVGTANSIFDQVTQFEVLASV